MLNNRVAWPLRACARQLTAVSKAIVLGAKLVALHARCLLVTGQLGPLQVGEIAPDTPSKELAPGATPKTAAAAAPTQITASAGPAAPVAGAKAVRK